MRNINFINWFHAGDLHVSRSFVKKIVSHMGANNYSFNYSHKNPPSILNDIEGLKFDKNIVNQFNTDIHGIGNIAGEDVTFSTWYGSRNFEFMNRWGITFSCLYNSFDYFCKNHLNFCLEDISKESLDFFPTIDFSKFHIENIDAWCQAVPNHKVFISNGLVLSGQAHQFSLDDAVERLAEKYKDIAFILTSKNKKFRQTNIWFSGDIIGKDECDLNENAYLALGCKIVCGKVSGPFTFAMNREQMFNRNNLMIAFSNLGYPNDSFWLGEEFAGKLKHCPVIHQNASSSQEAFGVLDKAIQDLKL